MTAAIVGVVANLAVFFASKVLFPEGFSIAGLDVFALVVAIISFVVLQRFKSPICLLVPTGAVLDAVDRSLSVTATFWPGCRDG